MEIVERHAWSPTFTFDGGDLDCGNGLLLLIRKNIDPLLEGQLLEIRSREPSVAVDLPAWCRLTSNELVSCVRTGNEWSYLVSKKTFRPANAQTAVKPKTSFLQPHDRFDFPATDGDGQPAKSLSSIADAPRLAPLSVMGIGSWPRPRWMLQSLHEYVEGRLGEDDFQRTADDAVQLCVAAQIRAGVDVVTDGEQRRDSYASFVGARLENCQLIPLTDLLPYVDDPQEFEQALRALDVPPETIRHPAIFGRLVRSRPLVLHEDQYLRTQTDKPRKIAMPGPYLLTRTMWMECLSDRAYSTREQLADDIVAALRAELFELLADGVAVVQFDEPVLTEVVFSQARKNRTFMCGSLGEKRDPAAELQFALELLERLVAGVPQERIALHICRGNWSRDEQVALKGDYRPLLHFLKQVPVGTLMLELCTPRAGELEVLKDLPERLRVGVGVVNSKTDHVESVDEIRTKAETAIRLFGYERVLLNPDCGFATFADNPVNSAEIAEKKLAAISCAAADLRKR
jgi:5-methyltetrahydropteroyltriglutamate--homocysteine methyltransferase